MTVSVKICGISTPEALAAAREGGARYVGFNFYPPSPRAVSSDLARQLALKVGTGTRSVGLFVEPTDALLGEVLGKVPLDMVQLHGTETAQRVAEIKAAFSLPVIKAVAVAERADLDAVSAYADVADMLLFDTKLPKGVSALPGGNGVAFDWSILAGRNWPLPWMLSGGLREDLLAEAVARTGARILDVSSGVEDRPGVKSVGRMRRFLAAGRALGRP